MAKPISYRVHENAVMAYMRPGGEVYDELDKIGRNISKYGKAFAPKRTGDLARNIRANRPKTEGPYKGSVLVYNNIRYARYVHEGTTGPIRAKSGKAMRFRTKRGAGPYMFAMSVSGQRANPYLERAVETSMGIFRAGG